MQEYLVSKRSSPRIIHDAYGMPHAVTDSKHPWKKEALPPTQLRRQDIKSSNNEDSHVGAWLYGAPRCCRQRGLDLKAVHCSVISRLYQI